MRERVEQEEIFSQILRAGRRTYFFDVRATKANDYYLTVTESKKFTHDDGTFHYQKHKIYLYKEDFADFREMLGKATDFILNEKGTPTVNTASTTLSEMELLMINEALNKHNGNYSAAANQLGISRQTLYNKIKKSENGE